MSLLVTAIGIPLLFLLAFGEIDEFAYGVTGFLLLLELAVGILPQKSAELSAGLSKVKRGRFDFLGAIWLLSIPFGPFSGWILTNAFDITLSNWRLLFAIRATVTVLVPLVCVLPLLRYVRGRTAFFILGVLVLGTAFPVLTGIHAAIDVVRGPDLESVNVTGFQDVAYRTKLSVIRIPGAFVDLSDGRRFTHSQKVLVHPGETKILVLRANRYILDAR
jgi:hypothetical protein